MTKVHAHFIDTKTDKFVLRALIQHVPRVGDEIRTDVKVYYKVVQVVWVYDEPENPSDRVNIGVSRIK